MRFSHEWIYQTLALILALTGLWLLYWSLLKARSRGRRRCPKCWYDMSGNAGSMRCSECGYVAKRERKFFKTRRRWRWGLAAILLIGICASEIGYQVQRKGVMSIVPASVLVSGYRMIYGEPVSPWQQRMCDELNERAKAKDGLWDWQWRMLIRGAMSLPVSDEGKPVISVSRSKFARLALYSGNVHRLHMQDEFSKCFPAPITVDVPTIRPGNRPMPILVMCGRLEGTGWDDMGFDCEMECEIDGHEVPTRRHKPSSLINVPASSFAAIPIEYEVDLPDAIGAAEVVCHFQVTFDVHHDSSLLPLLCPYGNQTIVKSVAIVRSVDDLIHPIQSIAVDQKMARGTHLRFFPSRAAVDLEFDSDSARTIPRCGELFTLQILHDSKVVYERVGAVHQELRLRDDGVCAAITFPFNDGDGPMPFPTSDDDKSWTARWFVDPFRLLSSRFTVNDFKEYWPRMIVAPLNSRSVQSGSQLSGELADHSN